MSEYKKNSITLLGAISLGTGVMIGAGIFSLLGQVAELSGHLFPFIFIFGGIVTGFSSYSYIKLSNEFPSSGGIATFLIKEYGKTPLSVSAAMLMVFSMIINQSFVGRTFGTYTLQLFDSTGLEFLVPLLGVGLLGFAFLINILSNQFIQTFSSIISLIKVMGLCIFAITILWVVGFTFTPAEVGSQVFNPTLSGYIASVALTMIAFKGFTTITNVGSEVINPNKNVGKAIMISIAISLVVYVLLAWAVSSNLSLENIIKSKDYALAEAARPAFGKLGVWFTVTIAILSTTSGVIASVFAVSRMVAMLTEMELIPHSHFGMAGNIQKHALVYTIGIGMAVTIFFDLTRIASIGTILYLVMDIIIHWGLLRNLREQVKVNSFIVFTALSMDTIVLGAFIWLKATTDIIVVIISFVAILLIFMGEKWFLRKNV
ncbi:APC family permease (plasmid) [Jeotgalibaca sp. MA1X17-3]|uniref:APC family permease n=1 Tax=Jeotgalibaca sp. MA1X17-3 TaxID=2908211 RepID=UPI001F2E6F95|nr:APC family permease [Jeotgalibaca sp. MA1X17-3]UJF16742.1 APC family permease [Jeotgalibaca sp. MA1X17-3]